MLALFSRLEKIVMVILMQTIFLLRSIMPLTYLRNAPVGLQRLCFYLTMHQAIKSVHPMHFLLAECPRTQNMDGHTTKMDHAWGQLFYQMAIFRIFIFQMNILNFLVTSRVWSKSFMNEGFGQHQELFSLSAKDSNVKRTKQIVAVIACCSVNQISSTRSHSLRNSSLCMAIFVIFIPNITVNWILLNNTGVQSNFVTAAFATSQQQLKRWKTGCWNA